jgi:hypothetical protein
LPESDDDDETEGLPAPDFTTPRELETRVPMAWQGQRLDRVLAQWQPEVAKSLQFILDYKDHHKMPLEEIIQRNFISFRTPKYYLNQIGIFFYVLILNFWKNN